MNLDRGQTHFTPEEIDALRERLRLFKDANGYSWGRLGQLTGVAAGTLSAWVPGTYNNGKIHETHEVTTKVNRFFLRDESQRRLDQDAAIIPPFQQTRTARRIHACLTYAQRGNIAAIVGDPGTGKTAALDQYHATGSNVWKVTMSPSTASLNACLLALMRGLGARRLGGASEAISIMIREKVVGRQGLFLIDEAQHLSERALEEIRAIHDDTGVGVALVGNREVLTRIEGAGRTAAFAQLYSRVSIRHVFGQPEAEDVELLLNAWAVASASERAMLRKVALKPGGGGLRSLTKTLELATLLAQQAGEDRVLDHLEGAWAQLSSRPLAA